MSSQEWIESSADSECKTSLCGAYTLEMVWFGDQLVPLKMTDENSDASRFLKGYSQRGWHLSSTSLQVGLASSRVKLWDRLPCHSCDRRDSNWRCRAKIRFMNLTFFNGTSGVIHPLQDVSLQTTNPQINPI